MYLQRWHGWCHVKLLPSRRVLCTPYNHEPCHFMQNHICKISACLAIPCHLHFWQNDRSLSCATAVTRGWNGYRNKRYTDLEVHGSIAARRSRAMHRVEEFSCSSNRQLGKRKRRAYCLPGIAYLSYCVDLASIRIGCPAQRYGRVIFHSAVFCWRSQTFSCTV